MRLVNRISALLGQLAAWLFVAAGAMLSWEVVGRYFFNAPTVWAAELSQLALATGVFFSLAELSRRRRHITVELIRGRLSPAARRAADVAALCFVAAFSAVIVLYGGKIAWDSYAGATTTGTILNLPRWWGEVLLPFGFLILFLQSVCGIFALVFGISDAEEK